MSLENLSCGFCGESMRTHGTACKSSSSLSPATGLAPQRVVCAAIRSNQTGQVVCGARHWDVVMRGQVLKDGKRPPEWLSAEQGFIDQFGITPS